MRAELREPTSEECTANALIYEREGARGFACWYPQMGGYVGKAVVEVYGPDTCFEVFVWHDGEFPFGEDSSSDPDRPPAHIHHCMAEQFIRFGQTVQQLQGAK